MNRLYKALLLSELTLLGISIFSQDWRIPAILAIQALLTLSSLLVNFSPNNRKNTGYLDALDGNLGTMISSAILVAICTPYYVLSALFLVETLVMWHAIVQVKDYLLVRAQTKAVQAPASPAVMAEARITEQVAA